MAPFYGWGSTASKLEPLRGGSLLFTTKFPDIPGTHFIDLGRMKGWVDPVVLNMGSLDWKSSALTTRRRNKGKLQRNRKLYSFLHNFWLLYF